MGGRDHNGRSRFATPVALGILIFLGASLAFEMVGAGTGAFAWSVPPWLYPIGAGAAAFFLRAGLMNGKADK